MQLMIDILAETPTALRLAAEFLTAHAALREASEVPTGTQPAAPPAPVAPSNVVPFVLPPVVPAQGATAPAAPPAPTSNLTPPPIPTNAPSAAIPATSASLIAPPAPISNVATVSPGASAAPPAAEEYDDHGVPYDGRIHQKGKSKKKDGSWKLQKGIADAVVSAVMQELASRIRKVQAAPPAPAPDAGTPVSVGASAPVTLPPVPPVPQGLSSTAPQAPLAPPAPVETVAPALDPYRALIRKVTEARTAKRCTAEEVTACAAAAGVPSLQALNAMPHLIPTVEAHIDALLATR